MVTRICIGSYLDNYSQQRMQSETNLCIRFVLVTRKNSLVLEALMTKFYLQW